MITARPAARSALTGLHIRLGNAQDDVQWLEKACALHKILWVSFCIS